VPIQSDVPTNTGAQAAWKLTGAASKPLAVATNDGDSSVIWASSGGMDLREAMQFPVLAGIADPVTSASLSAVTREYLAGGGGRYFQAIWNSVMVVVNRQAEVHVARPNYVTVTYNAAGGELALAAVNGEHGWMFQGGGGPSNKSEYWITHLYRTVNFSYTAGNAGEFAYMIGSIAAAFIGANLLLRDMPALARLLARRAGYLIRPDEYVDAHRAWREARCH
jgi:hypothetical protein